MTTLSDGTRVVSITPLKPEVVRYEGNTKPSEFLRAFLNKHRDVFSSPFGLLLEDVLDELRQAEIANPRNDFNRHGYAAHGSTQ